MWQNANGAHVDEILFIFYESKEKGMNLKELKIKWQKTEREREREGGGGVGKERERKKKDGGGGIKLILEVVIRLSYFN